MRTPAIVQQDAVMCLAMDVLALATIAKREVFALCCAFFLRSRVLFFVFFETVSDLMLESHMK